MKEPPRTGKGINQPYTLPTTNSNFIFRYAYGYAQITEGSSYTDDFGGYGSYTQHQGNASAPNPICSNWGAACVGSTPINLKYSTSPFPIVEPTESSDKFRRVTTSSGEITFDAEHNRVIIHDFRAVLRNYPYDAPNDFSALNISLTRSQSNAEDSAAVHDDNFYASHLVAQTRARLNNGKLALDGALRNATVETVDSSGVQIAHLSAGELILPLSAGVTAEEVGLHLGSDVGNLGYGISTKFQPEGDVALYDVAPPAGSSENITFQQYPNPASASTPLDVNVQLGRTEQVTIGLYDSEGNHVRPIYAGSVPANTTRTFRTSLTGIRPGIYYLRLTGRGRIISRRVTIN
ncbi:T9SS type A sorting domain-containing protein [Hymenobacter gummosus]|uniref:T9SS type A sorting domain-containing protein n=1 Tax=Hymenobacter gummosus TaxID=1776032 RepID=A0A431U7T5_9BACT|nr:T9SS type A sorting domain-containing protein [Hymenobacter gummosus]RTQ52522.1 T9SS type A sorting domain-containing protein [Hymenobacter gummosus]